LARERSASLSDWGNPFAPVITDKHPLRLGRESAERGENLGAKTERERAYLAAVNNLYRDFDGTPQQARWLADRNASAIALHYFSTNDDPKSAKQLLSSSEFDLIGWLQ
jgi:hypothetical protein